MNTEKDPFWEKIARDEEKRKKIIIFPGSKQDYEEFVGYKVKIVDTGFTDKGVILQQLKRDILDKGIEAIIYSQALVLSAKGDFGKLVPEHLDYGLPVRRKNDETKI